MSTHKYFTELVYFFISITSCFMVQQTTWHFHDENCILPYVKKKHDLKRLRNQILGLFTDNNRHCWQQKFKYDAFLPRKEHDHICNPKKNSLSPGKHIDISFTSYVSVLNVGKLQTAVEHVKWKDHQAYQDFCTCEPCSTKQTHKLVRLREGGGCTIISCL